MEIRNMEDKDRAERLDNWLVEAATCARLALQLSEKAREQMERIHVGIGEKIDAQVGTMIDRLEAMEKDLRQAARDWTVECIQIEDAIIAYDGGAK